MNQRISELAMEADLMRYPSDGLNIRIERFAELIVADVAEFLANIPDHGAHNYYKYASLKVQERYGAE